MQKRKIGSLEVSVVGLGCNNFGWRIGPDETKAVLAASLEAGVNFLDTADMYGTGQSEEYLGNALGKRRKEVVLCTKFGFEMGEAKAGASPKYVREAAEASLRRLKTDYIDLYLVHRPDPETPIADTLGTLNELASEGKVREIGCSNFSAAQLAEAAAATPPGARGFVTIQNEYSLVKRTAEEDVIPECKRLGISFIPYFPLANGLLSGKYRLGKPFPENSRGKDEWGPKVFDPEYLNIVEQLGAFAEQRGRTLLELAISWLACQDTVPSVIAGAKTPEQARANAAAGSWKLSPQEMAEVDAITLQHETVGRSV
jgi:aryl-alcohol dehydrogenase-like predicted oxidoreductase